MHFLIVLLGDLCKHELPLVTLHHFASPAAKLDAWQEEVAKRTLEHFV